MLADCFVRPATRVESSPCVSVASARNDATLFAIKPWLTTTLICGCAQETVAGPGVERPAATAEGAPSSAQQTRTVRRRLIRGSHRRGPARPLISARGRPDHPGA